MSGYDIGHEPNLDPPDREPVMVAVEKANLDELIAGVRQADSQRLTTMVLEDIEHHLKRFGIHEVEASRERLAREDEAARDAHWDAKLQARKEGE